MKRMFFARSNCSFFMTAIAAGLTAICPLATRAADTKPEEIRQKAVQLQRKAEELKAAGREEEAGKRMREVQELRDQAEGFEPGPREAGRKQRLQELNRELDRLKSVNRSERRHRNHPVLVALARPKSTPCARSFRNCAGQWRKCGASSRNCVPGSREPACGPNLFA